MKYKVHIAVGQYEFVEVDYDSPEEARQGYEEVKKAFSEPQNIPSLATKDWQRVLDAYLVENRVEEEDYTRMSDKQRLLINEIKKSLNRVAAKGEQGTRAESSHRIIN